MRERMTSLKIHPHEPIAKGTSFTIEVEAKTKKLTKGYQLGMRFDPSFFEVLSFNQGEIEGFSLDNFNVQSVTEGELRAVWSEEEARGVNFSNQKMIFKIHCRAKRDIENLERLIRLDDDLLGNMFADHKGVITGAELHLMAKPEEIPLILKAVYPNPTSDEMRFDFALNQDSEITIILQDRTGRSIQHQGAYTAGEHAHRFENLVALRSGVIHYTVSIGNEVKYSGQLIKF